jgi:hypothetical protein
MSTQTLPYIPQNPGDLITAGNWNGIQVMIKEDINNKIEAAKEEIKKTGVERADNADQFDNKTPKEWTDDLDQRYAPKVHDHEGLAVYRRYIKEFTNELDQVLLHHDLGRFPLVDVYQLLPVTAKKDYEDCKLLFYYGHADAEEFGLWVRVYRDRVPLGVPFEGLLAELGVEYDDDDTIEDVLNDMWGALMRDPNDEIKHCTTPWVEDCCGQRRTVKDLKDANQWPDLYVAMKPRKCGKGADLDLNDGQLRGPTCQVEVTHVNYQILLVEAMGMKAADSPMDLMILLRS